MGLGLCALRTGILGSTHHRRREIEPADIDRSIQREQRRTGGGAWDYPFGVAEPESGVLDLSWLCGCGTLDDFSEGVDDRTRDSSGGSVECARARRGGGGDGKEELEPDGGHDKPGHRACWSSWIGLAGLLGHYFLVVFLFQLSASEMLGVKWSVNSAVLSARKSRL